MANQEFNLIAIEESTIGADIVQTVNARDLHAFLEVGKVFAAWIKDRIEKYNFVENQDFVCFPVLESEGRGGQNRIDYHISIDMAKELSMVERNAKGKEARQYFIAVEKAYRSQQPRELDREEILVMALESERERKRLLIENETMKPKADYYDRLMGSHETRDGEYVAKLLRTSVQKLYKLLRERGILTKNNLPIQVYIDKDYMRIHQEPYERLGMKFVSSKVIFTQQGIQYVRGIVDQVFRQNQVMASA